MFSTITDPEIDKTSIPTPVTHHQGQKALQYKRVATGQHIPETHLHPMKDIPNDILSWTGTCNPDGYGNGRIHYKNEVIYEGEVHHYIPNGQGRMTYKNGKVYTGQFRDGKYHGKGILIDSDKTRYEGNFEDGKGTGQVKITKTDGTVYTGQYEYNREYYHGTGELIDSKGAVYKGEFEFGLYHGPGELTTWDKNFYKGTFQCGVYHEGTMTDKDGNVYTGQWQDGMRHGKGTMTYKNGNVYTGQWQDGTPHGEGTMTDKDDGAVYQGEFDTDRLHGKGTMSYKGEPLLTCIFQQSRPYLHDDTQNTQLSSTLFASLFAGTNDTGSVSPYSLQVLSKDLLGNPSPQLSSIGRELEFTASLYFLDPKQAEAAVLKKLQENRAALLPFGYQKHTMLLDLHLSENGIEARIYNSGYGLDDYHDNIKLPGQRKFQTCKNVLFQNMKPDSTEFSAFLANIYRLQTEGESIDEVYALFQSTEALQGSGDYQSVQKSGNCEFECIMALLRDRVGPKEYKEYKTILNLAILEAYDQEPPQNGAQEGPIRKKTSARLMEMLKNRAHSPILPYEDEAESTLYGGGGAPAPESPDSLFSKIDLPNGCYSGMSLRGKPHGSGIMVYTNKDIYEGEFQYGKPHGNGQVMYNDNESYAGEFYNGVPHGTGTMVYKDNESYEGEFYNGVPQCEAQ